MSPSLTLHDAFLSLLVEDSHAAETCLFEHAGCEFATFVRTLEDEARDVRNAPGFGAEPGGKWAIVSGGGHSVTVAAFAIGERSPVTFGGI